jgi:hypothetical protein
MRFGKTIVDVSTQGMQRNTALYFLFCAGDFRATQTATSNDLNAFCAGTHGFLNSLFHSTPEGHALLKLISDGACYQICIKLRLSDLDDLNADAFLRLRLKQALQVFDLFAAAPDHDTGFRGIDLHQHLLWCCTLDLYTRDRSVNTSPGGTGKLFTDNVADSKVFR